MVVQSAGAGNAHLLLLNNGGGLSYLATSTSSPATVYVASGFSLFRSSDSGQTFSRRAAAQDLGYISDLVVSPANADLVYLLTSSGVMKSVDGGGSFAPAVTGLPTAAFYTRDLAIDPTTPDTLILTSATHGAFRTTNGGANWSAIAGATLPSHLSQVAFDPGNPLRVLISPCAPDDGSAYTGAHLYRSTDGGTSFSPDNAPRLDSISLNLAVVPEPSAALLGALGILTLLRRRRWDSTAAMAAATSPSPSLLKYSK